ncbi:hypothetical protein SAMN05444581_11093 [Methylocapsa palsarum]|uniref:Uncharacterized protein n=1 Tax=Methylocapsa palsarum TaxID=1612308 RepID=A0A1I4AIT6_9HYPH|nr:hypothetical protein SAMN05444581_11093 [Methylocapsa palsarum]
MNEVFLTLEQYSAARRKIESVFNVERQLPEQVFKSPYRFHLLREFEFAMDDLLEILRKSHSPFAADTF